jgi:predicted alpha/beta-fold hydrolase
MAWEKLHRVRSFGEFDTIFTAPSLGYASVEEYWQSASCLPRLEKITIPTLLINAQDDTILTPACYPRDIARKSSYLYLETPAHGGHAGFVTFNRNNEYWSERRAVDFVTKEKGNESESNRSGAG